MKRVISMFLAFAMLVLTGGVLLGNSAKEAPSGVYMMAGSGRYLVDGSLLNFDAENVNVRPVILQDRTLVPLRALSEIFGADVQYDKAGHTAVVSYKGDSISFKIGTNVMIKNGVEKNLDTQSILLEDRTMIPLRVTAEELLGLNVDYDNRVIYIGTSSVKLSSKPDDVAGVKQKIGAVLYFASEEQFLQTIAASRVYYNGYGDRVKEEEASADFDTNDKASAPAASPDAPATGDSGSSMSDHLESQSAGGHTDTNVQVQGVDEADVMKTDGKFIYKLSSTNSTISIISADAGKMSLVSTIKVPEGRCSWGAELYIDKGRLVLVANGNSFMPAVAYEKDVLRETPAADIAPGRYHTPTAAVTVFDVSDPANPKKIREIDADGYMLSSRKVGNIFYLITNKWLYSGNSDTVDGLLPCYRDTAENGDMKILRVTDVAYFPGCETDSYSVISAFDIFSDEPVKTTAYLGSGQVFYQSKNALYLATERVDWEKNDYNPVTKIAKFAVDGTAVSYVAGAEMPGSLLNQFSMDEHKGTFRAALTEWNKGSGIYTYDGDMNALGSVTGLAEGERIYAVRFMGDVGYVVTFETIDPLFVLDLSNPAQPVVTGELKIPGFSNYLHPVGNGRLVGIGRDTMELITRDKNGVETVVGVRQAGIKLSLFDVSDMANPKEIDTYSFGDENTYVTATDNHKSILYSDAYKTLGFYAQMYEVKNSKQGYSDPSVYGMLFTVNGDKISEKGRFATQGEGSAVYDDVYSRMCMIGSVLYSVENSAVVSYDYSTMAVIGKLPL